MDATQMINDSIVESDEEEHGEGSNNDRRDPLGKLCILKNEHIPEKEFPLFLGDNVLGRDPNTCTLSLLAPSVSKQHATISLSVYKRKGCENEVEALLWDLGSMNGTRKGHFKLTPNVRYALSEEDCLVVADIPCKYMKYPADVPKDTRTPVTQNVHLKAKLSDALRENGSNLTGKTKSTAISIKTKDPLPDSEVMRGTPARTSCLSFEQTPTQPQGTLVPDSESESDEERSKVGDKRRKNIVSDSDSYKSSPTCFTFMSPTNKVVPESEDESPITPSSSYKNRTHRVVSFNNEESDIDINRQGLKKRVALEIVDDTEEEAGNYKAGSALEDLHDKSGQTVVVKEECNASLTGGGKFSLAAYVVPQFNMDSDTDVEEEEEKLTSAAFVTSNNGQDSAQFHMDSDTDVDDNDSDKCSDPVLLSNSPKHATLHTVPILQPKGISMDSDTDVEDGDLLSAATAKPTVSKTAKTAEVGASTNPNDFHLDSDTDVDEEEKGVIVGEIPSRLDTKPGESTSAPQSLHPESDTDDEGILIAAISKPPLNSAKPDFEILSNSDTNMEDNSSQVKLTTSGPTVAEGQVDTDEDTDVNEPIVSLAEEGKPDVTVDSDTDVEDKEAEIQEAGNNQIPILDREITPGIQVSLMQNCSTPVQLPEGNIEEIETQVFLSPSSPYRCTAAPGRPVTFSSCLNSQDDDDDFVVAETQSFILHDRGQDNPPKDPNISSVFESPVNEKNVSCTSGGNFQLELSDSSVLQCQAQALAMESTQAFVSVDGGVNLDETQPYADAIATAEKNLAVDIALQATQAYISDPYSDEEEETDEDQCTEQVLGAPEVVTSSAVPESKLDRGEEEQGEATQPGDVVSVAETQPMYIDEESDSEEAGPVFRKRKPKQIQEEESQPFTNSEVTVAETQPMEMTEETVSDENFPIFRKKKAKQIEEEETQPVTNLELTAAETQPVEMTEDTESDEDSSVFKKKETKQIQEGETQSLKNSELTVAETQPMEITENSGSDQDSPFFWRRKAKQLQPEEQATQPIEMSKDDQTDEDEDSVQIFRKRIVKCLDSSEDDTQPHLDFECTVAQTQLIAVTEESGGKDLVPVERTMQTPKQQPREKDISVAPTQPLVLSEDMASDEEDSFLAPKKRKAQKLENRQQSFTNSEEDTKPTGSKERPAEGETSNVKVLRRRGGARLGKEKQELTEEVSSEPPKRQTKGKNKAAPVSQGRRGKAKVEQEDEGEKEETQLSKEHQQEAKVDTEEIQQEKQKVKEDIDRLEKERIEEEKEAATKDPKENEEKQKEVLEHENKVRMEKEQNEKEEMKRLETERIEREEKEMAAKIQKEKEAKQKEKAMMEKEQKEREEKERFEGTKSAERQEEERKIQEHKTRIEMEKKERLERENQENFNKTKEDQAPTKGRRTARRIIAAQGSYTAADDDVPARRTRSRSNSSNSVGSERSVSSISSQTSRGKGRGRGSRRTEVQAEKPPFRESNRRRTVVAEASIQTTELSAPSSRPLSRSTSNNSLNYEVSIGTVSSQGRGRGGRQRGRGRRTEAELQCISVQSNQVTIQNAPQRGRKSARICPEDDEHKTETTKQSVSSRWQSGHLKCTHDHEEDQTNQEKASTSSNERRGGRKRQAENDGENKSDTKGQEAEEEEEEKDVNLTVKRKVRAKNTHSGKSKKGDLVDDNTKSEKPKGRGRPSVPQRKKSEEQGDSGSSGNNSMEEEANPRKQEAETPGCRVSRKRNSADSDSSPVAKAPRSSTASPSTVSRSRGASQSYKVLFTGVVDEAGEKVLSRLGGSLAKDVADMNCLVTDKVRRTVKFLCAVAKGVPIVTTQWLEKSGKAGTFLCPSAYIVKDREQEHKFNFNLQDSLRVANSQPLLKGYEIHVTKSVKPEPVHMKDIISCSGALFLPRMPSSKKPQTLVISCVEDWPLCGPALSSAIPVLSAEFILTGILQQKVDFEIHKLPGPVASAQATGGRGRGRKKT